MLLFIFQGSIGLWGAVSLLFLSGFLKLQLQTVFFPKLGSLSGHGHSCNTSSHHPPAALKCPLPPLFAP